MQLKSRQIILFVVTCVVLWISDFSGAGLLAVASLLQLGILVQGFPFTRSSQLAFARLFLLAIPSLLFWGAIHSFVFIYLHEGSFFMSLMAGALSLVVASIVGFLLLFSNPYIVNSKFEVAPALSAAFNDIKKEKAVFLRITGLLFVFSFVPMLHGEWKIVFALTATLFYLNRSQLKTAFARSS